jgi:hypothetical protein
MRSVGILKEQPPSRSSGVVDHTVDEDFRAYSVIALFRIAFGDGNHSARSRRSALLPCPRYKCKGR